MFCKGLIRRSALPLTMTVVIVTGGYVGLSSTTAAAATLSSGTLEGFGDRCGARSVEDRVALLGRPQVRDARGRDGEREGG